jgi:hypothetical protein
MVDDRLAAEARDRINVQNNPVNAIDPWGLWDLSTSYPALHGSKPDPNNNIPPGITWYPGAKDTLIDLFDNLSNFFPGPNTSVPPEEFIKHLMDTVYPSLGPKPAEAGEIPAKHEENPCP